jgi:ATP synthase protein I
VGLKVVTMADQDDHKARLEALERRLAAKREADAPRPHMEEHYSQAQDAWRMVVELVAGLGIGFVMGYGLDTVMGTKPFLMVVFTLLGFAAGVKTVIRTAQELQTRAVAEQAGSEREGE